MNVEDDTFDHFSKAVSDLGCYWVLHNQFPARR